MATTISRTDGNILRSDAASRDEIRAAAHLLASLLSDDSDGGATYVLDFHKDADTGDFEDLGVYDYEAFIELEDDDEEPYEDGGEDA